MSFDVFDGDPVAGGGLRLLARAWHDLGADPRRLERVRAPRVSVPLPSRLAVGDLAWGSVAAAALASGRAPADLDDLDPSRIALAFRSDRVLRLDGQAPSVWSPYSAFWQCGNGWIRTHGNYPHHAAALGAALDLGGSPTADGVSAALAALEPDEAVRLITGAGGLAVVVGSERGALDERLRATPLVDVRRANDYAGSRERTSGTGRSLAGIRVLDLTRVIAGPVATRTLALLGADVLRIDPPNLPEPDWQHYDTGHGKRSALLDAGSGTMRDLVSMADVVVLGYRPAGLSRLGLDPEELTARHPGLIVLQLSAWGAEHPDRRGFDSLVQAESGIAMIESADGIRPGALPAQALDHSAGYLLAATVMILLDRREREGGSWVARTSLRRIAAELLGMPRTARPAPAAEIDVTPHTATFRVGGRTVDTVRPAFPWYEFDAPRAFGEDQPRW